MAEDTTERRPYRPSNGAEGMDFEARFCARCHWWQGDERGCPIQAGAFLHQVGEPGYPSQWVYGEDGPTCTSFAARS